MNTIPPFPETSLERIAKILGDTSGGLTGTEIGRTLLRCSIPDVSPDFTKWQRLYNALASHQNKARSGNHVVAFIHKAINPVLYTEMPDVFRRYREALIPVLSFSSLSINENGRVVRTTRASNLDDALSRANKIKSELERRDVHPEVLKYCKEELMRESSFHAVLEAMKGISERLRVMSGSGHDGAELVQEMFSLGKLDKPEYAINPLSDDSFKSEQKGFVNLLIGMFGMFRNPTAHSPRTKWSMPDSDALDILSIISLVHRKIDNAKKY